jgi:hypothetical protein
MATSVTFIEDTPEGHQEQSQREHLVGLFRTPPIDTVRQPIAAGDMRRQDKIADLDKE